MLGGEAMAIYQCFFFSGDRIEYWENIECDASSALKLLLEQRLSEGTWDAIEAWLGDELVYRSTKLPDGRIERNLDFSGWEMVASR
jgi:hypothetical protein